MCSRVHLNLIVVIFQIFIFVVFSCRVWDFRPALLLFFGDLSPVSSPLLGIMIRRLLYFP